VVQTNENESKRIVEKYLIIKNNCLIFKKIIIILHFENKNLLINNEVTKDISLESPAFQAVTAVLSLP
jgi:hypothetical protein